MKAMSEGDSKSSRKRKPMPPPVGVFQPAKPRDHSEVVTLFAIGARIVATKPENMAAVSEKLEDIATHLVPPESLTAQECMRLWKIFGRYATSPKPSLRSEAGAAYCRDLEQLAQKMELPPLTPWEDLPTSLNDPRALKQAHEGTDPGESLGAIRKRAKELLSHKKTKSGLPYKTIAELLVALTPAARQGAFDELVQRGEIDKREVAVLSRWVATQQPISEDDETLVEVLQRVGGWLSK